jgi:formyl-CoA transferase
MQEVMVNFGRMPLARTQLTGRAAERVGNSSPSSTAAPSGLYACKGGGPNDYCFIYTARDQFSGNKQWHALLRTIGRPELIDDPRFADPQARFARKDEVDAVIAPWMAQQDKRVAMEELNGAGVPAGAVFDSLDIINDRSLYATGMLTKVQHPTRGEVTLAGWPMKMTGSSTPAVSAPPLLGQHTSEVLAEILDMNAEEVAALRSRGAI